MAIILNETSGELINTNTGRVVNPSDLSEAALAEAEKARTEILDLTDRLIAGTLTFDEWQDESLRILDDLAQTGYRLGYPSAQTEDDYLPLGNYVEQQRAYFLVLASEIAVGGLTGSTRAAALQRLDRAREEAAALEQENPSRLARERMRERRREPRKTEDNGVSGPQLRNRIQNFIGGSINSFNLGQQNQYAGIAVNEQRFLGACKHCPSCPGYAEVGVVPLGTTPMPGEACECGPNCCCRKELYGPMGNVVAVISLR